MDRLARMDPLRILLQSIDGCPVPRWHRWPESFKDFMPVEVRRLVSDTTWVSQTIAGPMFGPTSWTVLAIAQWVAFAAGIEAMLTYSERCTRNVKAVSVNPSTRQEQHDEQQR